MNDLSRGAKVVKLRPNKPVYQYGLADKTTYIEFDSRYLYERWDSLASQGRRAYLLHDLSPKLVHCSHIGENSLDQLKWGTISVVAAIIIFFSAVHSSIPLLAWSIAAVGAVLITLGSINLRRRLWTYIYDDTGELITSILADKNESVERHALRKDFEHRLSDAIENAKQLEYYD